jgi:lysophospholipase L1-like esterase
MKKWKLLAILCGALGALACGEVLLRLVGAPEVAPVRRGRLQLSADRRLVFEPVPNLRFQGGPTSFFEYAGQSNSLGYRDREHTPDKPAGTYRIAVLGDSIAAGYRIERTEDAFPARLEAHLRGAGLAAEVLSFGVTGYNTEQEVETLRARALRFSPDLVLVAYCHNDRRPPDPRIVELLRDAQRNRRLLPLDEADRLLVHSALYRFVRYGVLQARERRLEAAAEARGGDTVARSLHELAEIAREKHFPVLLAVFPYLPRPYEQEHARQHEWLAGIARREGLRYLDLRPAFHDCGPKLDALRFDRYHPTAAGHACAAAAMAAAVRQILAEGSGPSVQLKLVAGPSREAPPRPR